jgi:uncharacterized membrane protein
MDDLPSPPARRSFRERVGAISPWIWLGLAVGIYFAVSLGLSWLRAIDLTTTTWDMGIYQQALWSTSHGRPFWEAADAETGSYGSLLQVHSVFLLYLLVPLYAASPTEWTLFAVQSAVVALAAVPLFLLGRDLTGSGRWGLVAAVVYLAWAPVLSANLYDFHAEAFLPIELFAFVLLWSRSRYAWGFAVALVAFSTFEFAPILLFFAGVFFLLPDRGQWQAGLGRLRSAGPLVRVDRYLSVELRRFLGQRRVVASLALLGACVVAYVFLLLLREQFLASWFGFPPFPSTSSGYVVGATPTAVGLSWSNLSGGFSMKIFAWLVFFALLGFVPFLAPRALVISVPWAAFSLFSGNLNYVTFGFQYGFIEAASLLVAFTYGLVPIHRWLSRRQAAAVPQVPEPESRGSRVKWGASRPRRSHAATYVVVGLVVLVGVNIAATPIDPFLDNIGLGSAYRISISGAAGFANAQDVAAWVTPGASVVASDDLFPLVANDVNAYSFLWMSDPGLELPFNATNLPSFVLIAEPSAHALPPWLTATLYNASDYGVRAVAWTSPADTVLLFERGFLGIPEAYGGSPPSGGTYYGSALDPGVDGYVTALPGTEYPSVVVSSPNTNGTVWAGPELTLAAGNYTVSVGVRAWASNPAQPPGSNQGVLSIRYSAFGQPGSLERAFSYSTLNGSEWTVAQFSLSISEPVIQFEVRGISRTAAATIAVEYVSIGPEA